MASATRFSPRPPTAFAPVPAAVGAPSRFGSLSRWPTSPPVAAAGTYSVTDDDVSPPLPHRALVLTIGAIGVGAVMMGISYLLGENHSISPASYLRYAIVLTLALYAVVGLLVVTQITPSVRLRWHDGKPALGVAVGLIVGGGLSALILSIVSASAGHLDPDPRIVVLMSEGDAAHVIATVLITCAAAPLIEEVLFRGLLLESQRGRGTRVAIWISALAFAVWHLNPSALRYYALMGALLGLLYTQHGLTCSIAAHVGFNGVLTVAALSIVLSPGSPVSLDGLNAAAALGLARRVCRRAARRSDRHGLRGGLPRTQRRRARRGLVRHRHGAVGRRGLRPVVRRWLRRVGPPAKLRCTSCSCRPAPRSRCSVSCRVTTRPSCSCRTPVAPTSWPCAGREVSKRATTSTGSSRACG